MSKDDPFELLTKNHLIAYVKLLEEEIKTLGKKSNFNTWNGQVDRQGGAHDASDYFYDEWSHPMVGLFSLLTDDQKKKALAGDENLNIGSDDYKLKKGADMYALIDPSWGDHKVVVSTLRETEKEAWKAACISEGSMSLYRKDNKYSKENIDSLKGYGYDVKRVLYQYRDNKMNFNSAGDPDWFTQAEAQLSDLFATLEEIGNPSLIEALEALDEVFLDVKKCYDYDL